MNRLLLILVIAISLVGCAPAAVSAEEPTSLFGALSARFQLGSTEETVAHKQLIGSYVVTTKAEVLENRTVAANFDIKGLNEAVNPDELIVTYSICIDKNYVPPEDDDEGDISYSASDSCSQQRFMSHVLQTVYNAEDGLFYTTDDETVYHVHGDWLGELRIENVTTGDSAENKFRVEVSSTRPPSSTTFELVNLLMPFSVIGLFAGVAAVRKKQFTVPVDDV